MIPSTAAVHMAHAFEQRAREDQTEALSWARDLYQVVIAAESMGGVSPDSVIAEALLAFREKAIGLARDEAKREAAALIHGAIDAAARAASRAFVEAHETADRMVGS